MIDQCRELFFVYKTFHIDGGVLFPRDDLSHKDCNIIQTGYRCCGTVKVVKHRVWNLEAEGH